ncbi:Lrp/AsnC family transcriptional regulator [Paracoccus caeni]|uniref:Lrp/AsnC family transcriptional regulator n=1 Tax=Paracoccus caeni TaxID=657651 RepID=A0A934SFI0_9RHOB|nr:Lrp/AsnC family transcriptional regulator [Paracoccus caeni]MBK4216460.1 Lrp/AsnC family transcriptional regulator [Paracoccus caeni]
MFRLDDLDERIVSALQRDGSLSSAALAEVVNASPASCWRRVKALEEAGILGPTVRIVKPESLGRGLDVFCQIRMKSQDAAARMDFQRVLEAEPTILEVYSISGEWDYLLHLAVRGMADYEEILMHRILAHHSVAQASSVFALRRVKHTNVVPV